MKRAEIDVPTCRIFVGRKSKKKKMMMMMVRFGVWWSEEYIDLYYIIIDLFYTCIELPVALLVASLHVSRSPLHRYLRS